MMVSSKISLASVAQPGQVNPKRVNPEPRLRLQGPIHAIAKRCWLQHQCTRHAPVHGLLVLFWMLAPYGIPAQETPGLFQLSSLAVIVLSPPALLMRQSIDRG